MPLYSLQCSWPPFACLPTPCSLQWYGPQVLHAPLFTSVTWTQSPTCPYVHLYDLGSKILPAPSTVHFNNIGPQVLPAPCLLQWPEPLGPAYPSVHFEECSLCFCVCSYAIFCCLCKQMCSANFSMRASMWKLMPTRQFKGWSFLNNWGNLQRVSVSWTKKSIHR